MITCPYCQRKFNAEGLSRLHLKVHGKTALEVCKDFPDYPKSKISGYGISKIVIMPKVERTDADWHMINKHSCLTTPSRGSDL